MSVTLSSQRRRGLNVTVPGESVSSITFFLDIHNKSALSERLPSWNWERVDDPVTDTSTFSFTSTDPIYLDGCELIGYHKSGEFHPLPGGDSECLPVDTSLVRCYACDTRRSRTHLVLLSPENEYRYLGRNCIAEHSTDADGNPRANLDIEDLLSSPVELAESKAKEIEALPHYDIITVIAVGLHYSEQYGYVSRNTSSGYPATSDSIYYQMTRTGVEPMRERAEPHLLTAAMLRQCALDDLSEPDDRAVLMKATLRRDRVTHHSFGLLAYLPRLYAREMEEAAKAKREAETGMPDPPPYIDGYAGEIGEKLENLRVEVERTRLLPSGSTLVVMKSDAGHRLTWFASNPHSVPSLGFHRLKATVRACKVFQGTTDTTVTRCRFT